MNSVAYQAHCFSRPIGTSIILGGLFTGLDIAQGARFSPRILGFNIGGLYLYNVLQCPMEAIHGRPSAWHNVASGAIIGYAGVAANRLGIPFVNSYFFYRYPFIPPPVMGATVYGGIAFVLSSVLGGKQL